MGRPIRQETLIDRGVVRSRLPVEAAVLGRGARTDHLWDRSLPPATGNRAQGYTARAQFVWRGDKATRAQSFRGRMAMLGLYVPTLASWYSALRSELLSFPAGKYDDQVDALGLIGQLLDRITAGQRPITPRVEKPNPYRPMYEEFQECSIKLL